MVILGLDSSTSTTGWSFCENGKILSAGFVDTKKLETTKEKTFHVISHLEKTIEIKKFDEINLEAALSGFAGGFTSQQVIITLARHNAVFAYIIEEHFKKKVNLLSVNTMRKQLFGKCRIKGIKSKDFVKQELESLIPDVLNFTIKNKKGNWDDRNGDMYDAIVAGLYKN
jgi:Holliday junction resolvasome RuvABC endonuclease subunit